MRILVLGGTRFAGRHLVEMASERGHRLTLVNRGLSDPAAFPGLEQVRADRDGGLDSVRGREFDAVVDMCGYVPRVVRQSVGLLSGSAERYVFVSSISVYADGTEPGFDETAPVRELDDPTVEDITDGSYGGLKILCEREAEAGFPGRALIVRPGLIVGPLDRSDRFTYWVRRIALGGDVLAPAPADRPVQFIDARDLASWMLHMVEQTRTGTFNALGPLRPHTMREVLEACRAAGGSDARFEWVGEGFLVEQGVQPMMELPLWIPSSEPDVDVPCDVRRAVAAGLTFRPLDETVADTLAWDRGRSRGHPLLAGLAQERERELLARWRAG